MGVDHLQILMYVYGYLCVVMDHDNPLVAWNSTQGECPASHPGHFAPSYRRSYQTVYRSVTNVGNHCDTTILISIENVELTTETEKGYVRSQPGRCIGRQPNINV